MEFAPPFRCLLYVIFSGAYYHVASPMHPCRVMTSENQTVDLICQLREEPLAMAQTSLRTCHVSSVAWQRMDLGTAINVSDSAKYGIWETVQGWGMEDGNHLSLLRVRTLQMEDIGRYRCRVQCRGTEGRGRVEYHTADLCMAQPNTKYGR